MSELNLQTKKQLFSVPIVLVCIFSFWFWMMMLTVTDFIIVNDSIGYESLARIIDEKGIVGFLKNGLDREPLYPLIINLGMKLSRVAALDYHPVVVFLHICILAVTQLLMVILMRRLKINDWIISGTLLYFALSPAVVNSGLLLYSEIVTYPFSILIVLSLSRCWQQLFDPDLVMDKMSFKKSMISSLLLAFSFLGMTFVKASFQLIAILIVFPFVLAAVLGFIRRERVLTIKAVTTMTFFLVFYLSGTTAYKFANKIYNGNFAFTNRGPSILYGNAFRRTQPMDQRTKLASIGYAVGEDFCYERLGLEPCQYWHFTTSDNMTYKEVKRLQQSGFTAEQINKKLITGAVEHVFRNPLAYISFTFVEIVKMFFWEMKITTYVIYPDWVDTIYASKFLRILLGVFAPLVTVAVVIFLWWITLKKRFYLPAFQSTRHDDSILFSILVLLTSFYLAHAPFFLVPRYVFTLIPLYLSVAGYMMHRIFSR